MCSIRFTVTLLPNGPRKIPIKIEFEPHSHQRFGGIGGLVSKTPDGVFLPSELNEA